MNLNNQIILSEIVEMDKKLQLNDLPFDKGLPVLRAELDKIAVKHNTSSEEILRMYFEYMNQKNN